MSIPVSAPTSYHGIVVTASGVNGLYQNASAAVSAQEVSALDNMGNTKYFEVFDFKSDLTLDVTLVADAPTFMIGDVITLSGFKTSDLDGNYLVLGFTETQANTDFCKFAVTARKYLQNEIPAQASV